jgi:intraflagellar transport protein 140
VVGQVPGVTGEVRRASKYYARAKDYLSLVRVCCFKGDFQKASEIVTETEDAAAAYHLARQLEIQGSTRRAIEYYAKLGATITPSAWPGRRAQTGK